MSKSSSKFSESQSDNSDAKSQLSDLVENQMIEFDSDDVSDFEIDAVEDMMSQF